MVFYGKLMLGPFGAAVGVTSRRFISVENGLILGGWGGGWKALGDLASGMILLADYRSGLNYFCGSNFFTTFADSNFAALVFLFGVDYID